jgi:molybdenum cofactor cytidylyltransferase
VITVVVLAAGSSSRLGRPKQLLALAGKPVLQHVVEAAEASTADEIVVVLGHAAAEIARRVQLGGRSRTAYNPDHAEGQSTSLRAGLRAADPSTGAVVILLGDQPGVGPDDIEAVMKQWLDDPSAAAVQATYRGRPAHPVLFSRRVWPELERERGDRGARSILRSRPGWARLVEVGGDPPEDIDTEADYRRLLSKYS